jgi:ribonuclease-3
MDASPPSAQLATRLGLAESDALRLALRHTSYVNEQGGDRGDSNERLEFLGDAVVGLLVAEALYRRFPASAEGELTLLRAWLVRRQMLAAWARELDLGALVLLGQGEDQPRSRERDTLLAETFEAVIGAIYLEQGFGATRSLLAPFLDAELDRADVFERAVDPKSRLQWRSQALFGITPRYEEVEIVGPHHDPTYTCRVIYGPNRSATGVGIGKRQAQKAAAKNALADLDRQSLDEPAGAAPS